MSWRCDHCAFQGDLRTVTEHERACARTHDQCEDCAGAGCRTHGLPYAGAAAGTPNAHTGGCARWCEGCAAGHIDAVDLRPTLLRPGQLADGSHTNKACCNKKVTSGADDAKATPLASVHALIQQAAPAAVSVAPAEKGPALEVTLEVESRGAYTITVRWRQPGGHDLPPKRDFHVLNREKKIGGSRGSLEAPGPFLELLGLFLRFSTPLI